jgi:hypothetical protein
VGHSGASIGAVANGAQQRLSVEAALMANTVDEEGWSPPDATLNAVKQVTVDLACVEALRHALSEDVGFETESGGVLVEMCIFFDAEIERAVL